VGEGIRKAITEGIVMREDIYVSTSKPCVLWIFLNTTPYTYIQQLQTKYTSISGQNPHDMPYDASLSITDQVKASIHSSLQNFIISKEDSNTANGTYIDTLVLHTPLPTIEQTIEAWVATESFVPDVIHNLGISNCPLPVLKALCSSTEIKIKPAVVQNRFYPDEDYDVELRSFARENDIIYQSFWTLTANPELVQSEPVQRLSDKAGISVAAALYALVMSLGKVSVLDGTKSEVHMKEDLELTSKIEKFSGEHHQEWQDLVRNFKKMIGEPV
jgi:diketogulonate reductase-like aldo/keto reductase